jgi:hypothetical protein
MAVTVTKITLDTRELDRLTAAQAGRAQRIIRATAFAAQGEVAKRAPVDTSALANSIIAVQVGPYLWRVQDGVEYGIYQELGFVHHQSGAFIQNPFMVPGIEAVRPHFETRWRELFV